MTDSSGTISLRSGGRIRRLRLALGLTQAELSNASGVPSGTLSMIENGHLLPDTEAVRRLSNALDCAPSYLNERTELAYDRPKLRAYADASQRAVDRTVHDSVLAVEAVRSIGLRPVPVMLPTWNDDLDDDDAIDRAAADLRSAAGISVDEVVPNVIRAAERVGCVVLPLDNELGRHWGLSVIVDGLPVIRVSRPSNDGEFDIPGDRQRFTVAHELGHLILHAGSAQPATPAHATRMEREAHRFAAAFLVPGDALMNDFTLLGGRSTLGTYTQLKQKWGYSIKAFVLRFKELGVIDEAQARSLYKQISARRWNKEEPHRPGTESAVWLKKALSERQTESELVSSAATVCGLGQRYIERWLDWTPSGPPRQGATVT